MKHVNSKQIDTALLTILAAATLVAFFVFLFYWPLGFDYKGVWEPITRRWLSGATELFDENSDGFFNFPWAIFVFVPFVQFPTQVGIALLNTLTLAAIVFSLYIIEDGQPSALLIAFCVFSWATLAHLIAIQLDAYVLLGLCLGWYALKNHRPWLVGAAFVLMTVKPPNVLLVVLIFFWALRKWPLQDSLKAVSLPIIFLLTSFPIFGFDWVQRYLESYSARPPYQHVQITIWHFAEQYDISTLFLWPFVVMVLAYWLWLVLREDAVNHKTVAISIVSMLAITPYALAHHYVLLVPAIAYIFRKAPKWAIGLLFVTGFTAAIRYFFQLPPWLDLLYPTYIWALTVVITLNTIQPNTST